MQSLLVNVFATLLNKKKENVLAIGDTIAVRHKSRTMMLADFYWLSPSILQGK
jgi:hypothetical protein